MLPLAFVRGEAVLERPEDLFIPPDALEVLLEAFEGPLDFLLYLIRRHKFDIVDLPVNEITLQYMEYINLMQELNFELAAEYLVMAAMLAEIKSRLLLPKREAEQTEELDPRAELVRRLQEYEQFKLAATQLDAVPRQERDFFPTHAALADNFAPLSSSRMSVWPSWCWHYKTCSNALKIFSITRSKKNNYQRGNG